MTDTSKPIVRLETSSAAKKAQKKAVAEAKEQTIKLAIRLNEGINEALRTLIRYRGDLSTMALEALDAILHGVDGATLTAAEAIEQLLGAQIQLRNNRRLQAAMRSSRVLKN